MTEQLKDLWQLAFGDSRDFIDLFFRTGFSPGRCLYLRDGGQVTTALYWLDCAYRGQKQAYLYAVATHPDHRGKGLCRKLMDMAHDRLRAEGYRAVLLRPGDDGLRQMYRKLGYRDATRICTFSCTPGTPVDIREIGTEEYARLRRRFLPGDGAIQEGAALEYLAAYTQLYAGADFLLAGAPWQGVFSGAELLGNRESAPGILAALGFDRGSFRCPGTEEPDCMFLPLSDSAEAPGYLGLVFE